MDVFVPVLRTRETPAASTLHLIFNGLNWSALEEQLRLWDECNRS